MVRLYDDKGKPLCNFTIKVQFISQVFIVKISDSLRCPLRYVNFSIHYGEDCEDDDTIYQIQVADIDRTQWRRFGDRCIYDPNVSEKRVNRYLSISVRKQLNSAPSKTVYRFSCSGMFFIEGKPFFCTGTEVIHPKDLDPNITFEFEPAIQKMDVDETLSENEAASKFVELLSLSPDPACIITAYKLGFFMRRSYFNIGKEPKSCIYLYGRSGTQKTTFSSFLAQTYERNGGIKSPMRLNASIASVVNILLKNSNDVVVIDDLCPSDSKRVQSQQEETLIEVVRYIGDGETPTRMKGNNISQGYPECGVIFTGEYLIGKGSSAARFLSVEMMKPDGKRLRYFQEHPLIVSTFYRYYIIWFIEHYNEVCNTLSEFYKAHEDVDLKVHDRLREMHFFLASSYYCFVLYLYEKKYLSKKEAENVYSSFVTLLTSLVDKQNERVGEERKELEVESYWPQIQNLYRNGKFKVASRVDEFDPDRHDGLLHNYCFYFRRECLKKFFPKVDPSEIINELSEQRILKEGAKDRTKQISALHGMRFYVIPLSKLC